MDRRDFLKSTAAAGLAGATAGAAGRAGAAPTALPPPASPPAELERFLLRFDRGIAAIDRGDLLAGLLPAGARLQGPRARAGEALFRDSLRALYATGSFLELAPADQLHPGVQSRMLGLLPRIEAAVAGHQRLLVGLGAGDHALLQGHLRRDPELPMRLAERLDDAAIAGGLAPSKRGRLRLAATEVGQRLRTQPPSLLIGEYLDKTRRLQERDGGAGSTERALKARMGEAAFWEYRAWAERETLAWRERLAASGSAGDTPPVDPAAVPPSTKLALSGAKTLGIGLLVGGLCGVTQLSGMNILIFGVTVGVVLMVTGLVYLLIAGIRRLHEKATGRLEEDGSLRPEFREVVEEAPPPPRPPPPPAGPAPAVPRSPFQPD
jgi:hypothetical protein